jgi:ankyrin repeat protein
MCLSFNYVFYLAVFTSISVSLPAAAQSLEQLLGAVRTGDQAAVARMLDRGVGVDTSDKDGNSLLMLAARSGNESMVRLLLGRKANPALRNRYGDTALMAACLEGRLGTAKLLVTAGSPLNGPGWAPLHYAAFEGHANIVEFLLSVGADKNAQAPNGYTPLMLTVRNGNEAAARRLLEYDADTGVEGPHGETALSIAKERGESKLVDLLQRAGATR